MTYEDAMVELKSSTQLNLEVLHNHQGKKVLQYQLLGPKLTYPLCSTSSMGVAKITAKIWARLGSVQVSSNLLTGQREHSDNQRLLERNGVNSRHNGTRY